ncbi:low molecular weight protein-tyrosine-phosphatase [Aeromicrobium duanguangcaii]|uniref:protein-tyrosine-phosphatase n=1 Tax=Aeromicrobium duanguangcaii TaxID=2968086 RepID=A0ABY5KH32_9ACTN|nr:low molecular weight protein-tyrosine-phosphatase [Aeromicrobium duanguangcaii]MCD9155382.1 low molecular weight phosphotyrosine protein phosphatase [Aeromicrobium duanguangcaii]MCL3838350.1 low molecular weight phosphotyrosine protein phosphatase [Aeromicrobium duanguangcaii]UUI68346.1 low molecular weight phosphotyrosine protein phosphatase [Aeromicrobium duanguangcaii]
MTRRVALVCLGNICRSPMADVVLEHRLAEAGIDDVVVSSSGTGDWHVGQPMDERAATTLTAAGYDATRHRARNFTPDWFGEQDLILTMDASNHADVLALARSDEDRAKVRMYRSFDPEAKTPDAEVPDPWYGGPEGFDEVLKMVERTTDGIVRYLAESR